jgi:post-segregation antitoxin (ccd killing protein)
VDAEAAQTKAVEAPDPKAVRLNITIRPETYTRLQEARERPDRQINVSQVADAAINAELDRMDKPGIVSVVARLRIESDRRRGLRYRQGHGEGGHWARDVASWAEICNVAALSEDDVKIERVQWTRKADGSAIGWAPGFVGRFRATEQDYGTWKPRAGRYDVMGAPAFADPDSDPENPEWITAIHECDEFWRGWLSAVKDLFDLARSELEPIPPDSRRYADPDDIPFDDEPPPPDSDDIPF